MHGACSSLECEVNPCLQEPSTNASPLLPRQQVQMHVGGISTGDARRRPFRMMDHGAASLIHRPVGRRTVRVRVLPAQFGPPLALEQRFPMLGVDRADRKTGNAEIVLDDERKIG